MKTLKKILFLLNQQEIRKLRLLFLVILINSILEMIGIASILPFVSVLVNPNIIETNTVLNYLFKFSQKMGVNDQDTFIIFLGILVFILLIISLSFKALTNFLQIKFVYHCEYSLGKRLIEKYLHQNYSWFLNKNSSDIAKTLLSEISVVISRCLVPIIELCTRGSIVILLMSLLIIVDPEIALIISLTLGGSFFSIFYFLRDHLKRFGKNRLMSNQKRFETINECFGGIKEIKFSNLEEIYVKQFSNSAQIFARNQSLSSIFSQLPRYLIESVAFGGILLIILYSVYKFGSFNNSLPILSLYVFAGYRLMPALQQIYASASNITSSTPSLNKLYEDYKNLKIFNNYNDCKKLSLNKKIELNNICYKYPNAKRIGLNNINITINAKTSIGIVGVTGSGKTTLVDIIMGLLRPDKGNLSVDGMLITEENLKSWQASIGYVPQQIYLSDDTIESNIAFGVDPKDINQDMIKKVAEIANLNKFIHNELDDQYQTIVGERGVRLSGGQRQRIGIARALYHEPSVLIFDEATSALDNETEKVIMDEITNLSKNLTILIVAHRLNTIKNCDNIFLLENGSIIKQGNFNELFVPNENFSSFAKK